MTTYLGIDLGTSGIRALLVDEGGAPLASASKEMSVSYPHPGWCEQDPGAWIEALESVVGELKRDYPRFADIRAIGVAGHMHGATLLDADDRVIRPCILWNDTRSHAEATRLDAVPGVQGLSGNIVFPGFTAPKLLWVQAHEPENFERVAKVLLPAAYLNHYLTGDHVADMSDSAGTSWLDVGGRDWSENLLAAGGMRRDQMPRLVEGSAPAGVLRADLAMKWGLLDNVVIAGGAGDNAAAACGIGALNEGDGFVSLGTSGVVLAARGGYHPAPETAVHTFCHAVPERWYQMGVMLSATDSLNWLGRITGQKPGDLARGLGDTLQAPGRVRFLPYLSGERTPHNDADIRGSFTGLGQESDVSDLTRAVFEGVAFGLKDSFEAIRSTGAELKAPFAIGGGTRSRYWVELMATVFGVPLNLPEGSEFGAALGAARLGMVAATGATPSDVMSPPGVSAVVEPNPLLIDAFEESYAAFKATYPAIRAIQ
ncbi:xylulokinase [Amaricoccus macauensis]|uniref:xylulokinase n=1 Tax=Amaricoccus macauensis TaxID=57001 RepID=UPI003C7AF581